jgi:ankyrin repeat protein
MSTKLRNQAPLLVIAVQRDHVDVVRYFIREFGTDVNQSLNDTRTLVYIAVEAERLDVVQCLIKEFGADTKILGLDTMSQDGLTPFCGAARAGHIDVVRYFVEECGASVNWETAGSCNGSNTPLRCAAWGGQLDMARYLVNVLGVPVNDPDEDEHTPLTCATGESTYEMVRCLVMELVADVNQGINGFEIEGATPLQEAAYMNNRAIIKHLVHKGACVGLRMAAGPSRSCGI